MSRKPRGWLGLWAGGIRHAGLYFIELCVSRGGPGVGNSLGLRESLVLGMLG